MSLLYNTLKQNKVMYVVVPITFNCAHAETALLGWRGGCQNN